MHISLTPELEVKVKERVARKPKTKTIGKAALDSRIENSSLSAADKEWLKKELMKG